MDKMKTHYQVCPSDKRKRDERTHKILFVVGEGYAYEIWRVYKKVYMAGYPSQVIYATYSIIKHRLRVGENKGLWEQTKIVKFLDKPRNYYGNPSKIEVSEKERIQIKSAISTIRTSIQKTIDRMETEKTKG